MANHLQAPDEPAVRAHLQEIVESRPFARSKRLKRFLTYIVEAKLRGDEESIQEYAIGLEVFDRRESFDPRSDSIVRSEARRLRQRLAEFYETSGRTEGWRIDISPPGYVPRFCAAPSPAPSRRLLQWAAVAGVATVATLIGVFAHSGGGVDPRAREAYQKGVAAWDQWTQEGALQSERFFEEALAIDPEYAEAYVGLSRAYRQQLVMGDARYEINQPKAIVAANRAIELEPELPTAHQILAVNLASEPDWPGAQAAFLRALELDPDDSLLHHTYAIIYLAALGRLEEAETEIRRAVELDAQILANHVVHGKILYFRGRYDEARRVLGDALAIKEHYPDALRNMAAVILQQGDLTEAVRLYRRAQDLSYLSWGDGLLAHALAVQGEREQALTLMQRLEEGAKQGPASALGIATAYVGLGDKDRAFAWLERAWETRETRLRYLAIDPLYDSLHPDPRFGELLVKMQLPARK